MIGRLFASLFSAAAPAPVKESAPVPVSPPSPPPRPLRVIDADFAGAMDTVAGYLKEFEGLRLEAYPDPGSRDGKPWTIGYGTTRIEGMPVWKGLRITQGEAEMLFQADLRETMREVSKIVHVPLTDKQLGALTSFTYNLGIGALSKSTLLKLLNAGDYAGAAKEFDRWVYNDGKVLNGLVKRRAWERALFESKV